MTIKSNGEDPQGDLLLNVPTDERAQPMTVDVVDDTPEADRRKPVPEVRDRATPEDDELSQYSEGVQKRLKEMTLQVHENRREAERVARERDEAISFSKRVLEENKRFKGMITSGEKVLVDQAKGRVAAEIAAAKRELEEAHTEGDTKKLVEAQTRLARLAAEEQQVKTYTPTVLPEDLKAPVQTTAVEPTSVKDWRAKNPWFQQDMEMTAIAYVMHEKAVKSGVQPETPEYYKFIDDGMRKRFPENFEDREQAPVRRVASTVVAPVTRSSGGKTSQRVTLTASQVSIARRLGLTPEQYAAQVIEDSRKRG